MGCNTSIDITHGMGEVTNAYVTLKNYTGADMTDVCATLYALDEGRVHPDKTVCVPALTHGQQVTLKLTVDSTYKQNTPIQIEVKSGNSLLSRIGQESCTDIGLFAPAPDSLLTPCQSSKHGGEYEHSWTDRKHPFTQAEQSNRRA